MSTPPADAPVYKLPPVVAGRVDGEGSTTRIDWPDGPVTPLEGMAAPLVPVKRAGVEGVELFVKLGGGVTVPAGLEPVEAVDELPKPPGGA